MPLYPFIDVNTGQYRELLFPMSEVPAIGVVIEDPTDLSEDSVPLRRLPSGNRISQADADREFGAKFPLASDALPRWTQPVGMKFDFDLKGRPIIKNKRHEADIAARMNMDVGGVEKWGES